MSIKDRTLMMGKQNYGILVIRRNLNGQVSGSVYHHLHEEELRFSGFMELAEKLQLLFGLLVHPAAAPKENRLTDVTTFSRLEERVNRIEGWPGRPKPQHTYRLQLYHCFRGTCQGCLEDRETGERNSFESFLELIHILEKYLGILPWQSLFPEHPEGTYLYRRDGQRFAITILFSRNNTWQGTLRWMNGKKTVNFKSCLELMLLLNDICWEGKEGRAMCTGD